VDNIQVDAFIHDSTLLENSEIPGFLRKELGLVRLVNLDKPPEYLHARGFCSHLGTRLRGG